MGKLKSLHQISGLLLLLLLLSEADYSQTWSSTSLNSTPLCLPDDKLALLLFKSAVSIDDSDGDPKTNSWNESTNCCTWGGVTCDEATGQVIGLDLSYSKLVGSLSPDTALFSLQGLRQLNLAFNNFSASSIPSGFSRFVSLTHLNLSASSLSGLVPSDISLLSNLISLDLHANDLKFDSHGFSMLIRNLSKLEHLVLGFVNMSDVVPASYVNLSSSLKRLSVENCDLHGEFPGEIFQLQNLEYLDLSFNSLTGYLPKSNWSSSLKYFSLSNNHFGGSIPATVGNLTKITSLYLSYNEFQGQLPATLFSLEQVEVLELSGNRLEGFLPARVSNGIQSLESLGLVNNLISGAVPSWLFTLPSLEFLDLSYNKLTGPVNEIRKPNSVQEVYLEYNDIHGEIPSSFFDLANLTLLDMSSNKFSGVIESDMLSKLENLKTLDLSSNNFSGVINFDVLSKMKNLTKLDLSNNKLLSSSGVNSTFQVLETLHFSSCSVRRFPHFLRSTKSLMFLDLSNNAIEGSIFKWESEGWEQLYNLNLSHNLLTGLEQFPGKNIEILDLCFNQLRGPLPAAPPPYLLEFLISNNNLTGEILPSVCNLTSLDILDFSSNYLGGIIPACLGNFSNGISTIKLQNNNFNGKIPDFCVDDNRLMNLALNDNQLEGMLPRSLINCTSLKFLNLANNKLSDTFPHWLGVLPDLQILILRFNKFHGPLTNISRDDKPSFSSLQVVDLSRNEFSGRLPSIFFQNLHALKHERNRSQSVLQDAHMEGIRLDYVLGLYRQVSVNVTSKGSEREQEYISTLRFFTAIDLSNNRLYGKIPDVIGELRAIQVLNLSHNSFTDQIPPSMENLVALESLDLSSNKLSSRIPSGLTKLTFLAVLNFSHNNLAGPIPHGNQFNTFENDSYSGNPGLCGFPLTKQCGSDEGLKPPAPKLTEDEGSPISFFWKLVMMGYGSGVVLGLSTGYIVFTTGRPWWFVRIVERDWQRKFTRWIRRT